jgi:hypothetical protein
MAKTLAGVLAVSIAALLFASCGGGDNSTKESSDRYLAAVVSAQAALGSFSANGGSFKKESTDPLAAKLDAAANDLLQGDWPKSVDAEVTALAKNYVSIAAHYRMMTIAAENKVYDSIADLMGKVGTMFSENHIYGSVIRGKLKTPSPPPGSP